MRRLFLGGAGTGKTHQLRESLCEWADEGFRQTEVTRHKRILGLTFMHGSRIRMTQRMVDLPEELPPVSVETLDAFSLRLVRRYRRRVGLNGKAVLPDVGAGRSAAQSKLAHRVPLQKLRELAADLLGEADVGRTVRSTYPIMIVDEAQDCDPSLLAVVKGLALATRIICAADAFQELGGSGSGGELEGWFQQHGEVRLLSEQFRMSDPALLRTASAIRDGTPLSNGIAIEGARSDGQAAFWIRAQVHWDGWKGRVALISPVGPERAPFVRRTLERLKGRDAKKKQPPAPFQWEGAARYQTDDLMSRVLEVLEGRQFVPHADALALASDGALAPDVREVLRRASRRARLRGEEGPSSEELEMAATLLAHTRRISALGDEGSWRRAMTVYQAKNREFDYVFVLWPYQVQGDVEKQRRLLYNAVTRAKKGARVIVQGGRQQLSKNPMFSTLLGC